MAVYFLMSGVSLSSGCSEGRSLNNGKSFVPEGAMLSPGDGRGLASDDLR